MVTRTQGSDHGLKWGMENAIMVAFFRGCTMAFWTVLILVLLVAALVARGALLRLCKTLPTAEISGSTGMYVQRWHLIWNEKRFLMVVHRFLGRDLDDPHNHSGLSLSVVLGGRGVETYYRPDGSILKTCVRRAGQVVFRSQSVIHRLDSSPDNPLVSLFILLPRGLDWGFFTANGFVPGSAYRKTCGGDKRFKWISKPQPKP